MILNTQGLYILIENIDLNNSNGDSIFRINVVQGETTFMKLKINNIQYKMEI